MHRIALQVHRATGIPWIADFVIHGPITTCTIVCLWEKGRTHPSTHGERSLRTTTGVVTVSWQWAEDMKQISGREVEVITNGYDEADFQELSLPKDVLNCIMLVHCMPTEIPLYYGNCWVNGTAVQSPGKTFTDSSYR